MIVKTKKYKLPIATYIQLGLGNIIRTQWWVGLIFLVIISGTFFIKTIWFIVAAIVALILYFLFWVVQFYGMTQLEQSQLMFERLSYEITSKQLMIQLNSRQGMPILWDQVGHARKGEKYFLFIISKVHLIHLPFKIFNSEHEIKFVTTLLQRKGILK